MSVVELPELPSLVVGRVDHTRYRPKRHSFSHRHYQWLVDVDDLPDRPRPLRWVSRFAASDHLEGGVHGGIRGDLATLLAGHGTTLGREDRVVMLAHARVLGHVFDPLSVFWVVAPDGAVRATVFEVHNTYGGRHAYVIDVDEAGRGSVDKAFTVSPFNDLTGRYAVRIHVDGDSVAVLIALDRDGERVLTASTSGRVRPATDREVARTALRHMPMTWWVSALIRVHGVWLWSRRLPLQPRPATSKELTR